MTGAAQGFGLEIAQSLAAEGAHVVLTDINERGAAAAAHDLCQVHGLGRAISLPINVTNGGSVAACIDQVVRTYGGFDLFISNAGVLKAESVKTQSEKDFEFVTDVNYKGYFLCVQKAAPILATQHKAKPDYLSDIIQINSKSGLAGSNRNAAYAGSKFGGIGLTQSFALELVEDGIKVNSICPGNFFDGPLWSDPDNGLFVQYLRAARCRAQNHRGRAPRLRSQSAAGPRLHDGGRDEGDLLPGRAAVRNRPGLAGDGRAGDVELTNRPDAAVRQQPIRLTATQRGARGDLPADGAPRWVAVKRAKHVRTVHASYGL